MKRIRIIPVDDFSPVNDIKRLQRIFKERGYEVTESEVTVLWERYSESMAAGWMSLDKDDDLVFAHVEPYFETI